MYKSKKIAKQTATVAEFTKYINKILPKNTARDFRISSGARTKLAQKPQTKQSARTRLAFLAAAVLILVVEIYIAICVKGGFVRHYAGDVLAVILLYALTRAAFGVPPLNLPLKIFAFAVVLEIAQYFGAVQILGIENKILKVVIGGTFDFADLLCYAAGCILAGTYEKFESKIWQRRSDG